MSFAKYNISHLSPSSLNLFLAEPAMWVMKYVHNLKSDAGYAAKRGTAVEAGMTALLLGATVEGAVRSAEVNWRLNTDVEKDGVPSPDVTTEAVYEADLIKPMVEQIAQACAGWPRPISTQRKVALDWSGAPSTRSVIPIIGYLDYELDEAVIDLKTTKAAPSAPRPDHVRQGALYAKATNKPVTLLYVTPKRHVAHLLTPDLVEQGWAQLTRAASALERVLAVCTREDLTKIYVPDFDHYVWDDKSRLAAQEVYNAHA